MKTRKRPAPMISNIRFPAPKPPLGGTGKLMIAAYVALSLSASLCLYVIHAGN